MTTDSAAAFFSVPTVVTPTRTTESIVELTSALAAGDEAAFGKFHRTYAGRLLRYALTITRGDFALAEEAVQLALIRIASKVRRFSDENAFWAWLARVVRSCVIDCARRHSRYTAALGRLRDEMTADPVPEAIERAFSDQLQLALATLAPADRDLLTAKYEHGESTASLAALADCSPKAMESRLARLRQRIRESVVASLNHEA